MNKLLDRVKEHEGFRSKVYKCTEGYDTIGYGFAIKDLELDEDLAEEILMRKLEKLIKRVRSKFDWLDSVPHEVQGVLVEMSYQMGLSGVSKFNSNGLDLIDTGGRSYTVISFSVGSMVDNLLFNFSFIKIG